MRVAISQPEHFPYLGYFRKMVAVDLFVLLDNVQFSGPRSFQNRNRFYDRDGQLQWFTVPVEGGSYFKELREVRTAPDFGWRRKLLRKLAYHFGHFDFSAVYGSDTLVDINYQALRLCREFFAIDTPLVLSSDLPMTGKKGELIRNICWHLGASTYVAGQGSREYMNGIDFGPVAVEYIEPVADVGSAASFLWCDERLVRARELIDPFRVRS